ncbi:hypothetical protein Gasu2_25040 [Galdieria sulphuraria]|nr:hypothetical protein Gasu2_25040 [Galdieria sulphuraria]
MPLSILFLPITSFHSKSCSYQVSSVVASLFAYSNRCLATEGTGEPLGVDDPRVLVVLTIIPILVFLLWLQFNGQQSNDDFMDTYDQRRR